ncbi:MAG TPA: hypothetical protein DCZ01_12270 [Elusimicrobia bacterium]|nr:MAG: hypothetical protein A2X37_07005 [Elusimicrobia bacterium GWA2_66_18]OGR74630.1 MAG: hypothetical protein A2X40_01450 [Elusimicrobia bacterium GWC2_65_9]HAZ09266.1 hypothetical protein [Elusimicrobiota bacterium]
MNDQEERVNRPKVSLYRCTCRHCDAAEEELRRLALRYGAIFEVQRVDRDERLRGFAGWSTPIVAVDGVGVTQFKVDVKAWEEALISRTGGKPPALVGFVVDMCCYFKRGVRPAGHEACALECFAAGGPVGIAALDGRVFLALPDKRDPAPFESLKKKPGEEVWVEGEIRLRDGLAGIVVSRAGEP